MPRDPAIDFGATSPTYSGDTVEKQPTITPWRSLPKNSQKKLNTMHSSEQRKSKKARMIIALLRPLSAKGPPTTAPNMAPMGTSAEITELNTSLS